jgi:hypothetical protein
MKSKYRNSRKVAELLGVLCGGLLIGLPAIPLAVFAQQAQPQPTGKVNPCPKIFYEEPHNSEVPVPQGCPPNAYTQQHQNTPASNSTPSVPSNPSPEQTPQGGGGQTPAPNTTQPQSSNSNQSSQSSVVNSSGPNSSNSVQTQNSVIQSSSSPQQQAAVATITVPANGKVSVSLVNQTNTPISYQAIGDTEPRTLPSKSDVMLQSLRIPATITFHRQDGGLLMVTPQGSPQDRILRLTLRETTDVGKDRSAMRIEQNGAVYLN